MNSFFKFFLVLAAFPAMSLSAQETDIMNMKDLSEQELTKLYGAPDTLYQEWGTDIATAWYSDSEDLLQFWINNDGTLSLGHYILTTDKFSICGIRTGDSIEKVRQLEGKKEEADEEYLKRYKPGTGMLEWFPPTWFYPNDCTGIMFYYNIQEGTIISIQHECAMM